MEFEYLGWLFSSMRPRASFHSKAALLFWNGKENAMNYIPKRVFLLECGITQAAVSQRLQRILRKLRRELESA